MFRFLNAMNTFLGRVVSLAVVALVAVAGWFGYHTYFGGKLALEDAQKQIAKQEEQIKTQQREIERLNTAVRLLTVDHRMARIDVLSQEGAAKDQDLTTRFSFVEVDEKGRPLDQPRLFTIKGDVVYLDHLIIKFKDEYIEKNDPLRNRSLVLFRRIFGEKQKPEDGFELDVKGSEPAAYRSDDKMTDFERTLWSRFWEYTQDEEKAKKDGVHAAHGDAVYTKLLPKKRYRVDLRASAGLSIKPDDLPAGPTF